MITIRKMTVSEYEEFYRRSFAHHVLELMEQLDMSKEDAEKETAEELASMLPDGMDTTDNHLMSIVDDNGVQAGFIWTLHEYNGDVKQSFLCDIEVYEPYRRRGCAAAAVGLMEEFARNEGCSESVLFVADDNTAANALYERCGYSFLRRMEYGRYMKKSL